MGEPGNGTKALTGGHVECPTKLWPVIKLKPFPRHAEFGIPELEPDDRRDLRADIAKNQLQHPLDIWPREDGIGIVLAGHERFLAVFDLGWTTVPCRERHDLDTEFKRADFVLRDNLLRRQLNESQRAAIAIKRVQIAAEHSTKPTTELYLEAAEDANVRLGDVRNRKALQDALIDCPEFAPVVAAADAGDIDLLTAARAARLPPADRAAVAREVALAPRKKKNRVAAVQAQAHRDANAVSLVDDDEPNTITHPKQARANVRLLADFEERLAKDESASQPTITWIIGAMRRAAAKASGADLEAVNRFLELAATSVGPMGRPGD